MIGDNPESDIAGAIKKGWTSILVKTGVFDPKAATSINGNDSKFPATHVVEDFKEAVNLIFRLEEEEKLKGKSQKPALDGSIKAKDDVANKPEEVAQRMIGFFEGDASGRFEERKRTEVALPEAPPV